MSQPATLPRARNAMGRREALSRMGLLSTALLAAGCTPMQIVLRLYPEEFDESQYRDNILRAFVLTVIPGAAQSDPNLIRALIDEDYPLASHSGYLASDLHHRSRSRFGRSFDQLGPDQRTEIVMQAVASGGTTTRLYTGAIFLTQIAYYAGIYDPAAGCRLIGFDGRYRFTGIQATTHPDHARFLATTLTTTGDPA